MLQVPVSRQVSRYLNSFVTKGQFGMGDVSRTVTLHNLKKVIDCSLDAMNTESAQRVERAKRYMEHHTHNPQVTSRLRVHLMHVWICRSAVTAAIAINPLSVDVDVSDTYVWDRLINGKALDQRPALQRLSIAPYREPVTACQIYWIVWVERIKCIIMGGHVLY